jgi:hypothetical protein
MQTEKSTLWGGEWEAIGCAGLRLARSKISRLDMLNEFSCETRFVLCILAAWRLTHLIVAEDGPWDIVVRVRARLGDSMAGRIMDCFYCSSVWIAVPFAFVMTRDILGWLVSWLAISGAASLLEQATNREINRAHSSRSPERKE